MDHTCDPLDLLAERVPLLKLLLSICPGPTESDKQRQLEGEWFQEIVEVRLASSDKKVHLPYYSYPLDSK